MLMQISVSPTCYSSISDSSFYPAPYLFEPFILFSLEEICAELVSAIEAGDVRSASVCASSLAKQRAALSIQPSKRNYTDTAIR